MTSSDIILCKLFHCFHLLEQYDVYVDEIRVGQALFDFLAKDSCGHNVFCGAHFVLDKTFAPWRIQLRPVRYFDTQPMFNVVRQRVEDVTLRVDEDIEKMPVPPPPPPPPSLLPPPPPPVARSAMLVWDADDPSQFDEAMVKLRKMLKKGYAAFVVDDNGRKKQQVNLKARDKIKKAEELLFIKT